MNRYYYPGCAGRIAQEVVDNGNSTGWSGETTEVDYLRETLAKFNIHYTDDMRGTWEHRIVAKPTSMGDEVEGITKELEQLMTTSCAWAAGTPFSANVTTANQYTKGNLPGGGHTITDDEIKTVADTEFKHVMDDLFSYDGYGKGISNELLNFISFRHKDRVSK